MASDMDFNGADAQDAAFDPIPANTFADYNSAASAADNAAEATGTAAV